MDATGRPVASEADSHEVLISSDAHVEESPAIGERIPKNLRHHVPRFSTRPDGGFDIAIEGYSFEAPAEEPADEIDLIKEFRNDPSGGTDLSFRMRDMATEGVDAQVIFPNIGLLVGSGDAPPEFRVAWSRAYNDWAREIFSSRSDRFCVAAMIPVDSVEVAVAEAKRAIDQGFKTLFLPPSVPWCPYFLERWDPLWRICEEAEVVPNFHVFSGNLGTSADFAQVYLLNDRAIEAIAETGAEVDAMKEVLSTTVIGMAAGMAPVVHLTAGGALERHPNLRFIVTEAEAGWLAWSLQQMDRMQERRHMFLPRLPLKPSEYFLRQGFVTITDDPVAINNLAITGCDCIIWGNDYPHDEGTFPFSRKHIDQIKAAVSTEDAQKILSGNAARLFGFDVEVLAAKKAELATA